jgi:hypothetical protein
MTETNFEKGLQAFRRRRPLKSFIVELVSGSAIVVDHPEALATRGSVGVYIDTDGNYTFLDATSVSRFCDDLGSAATAR